MTLLLGGLNSSLNRRDSSNFMQLHKDIKVSSSHQRNHSNNFMTQNPHQPDTLASVQPPSDPDQALHPQKLDVWKVMIREDVKRFKQETEDREAKRKTLQADYRSYLDRQLELQKQRQLRSDSVEHAEAEVMARSVQRLAEMEL